MNLKLVKDFKIYIFIVFILLVMSQFVISYKANAQVSTDINVSVIPENMAPGEEVSITLSSYIENLDITLITWYINGKNVLSGIGKKDFSLMAPALGMETVVTAKILFSSGETEIKTIIKPSVMVLLSEATDSYVPPFYRGKALLTPGSQVKIVAMPEIRTSAGLSNPKNMTYAWRKDFSNEANASGYGKNYFTYPSDYLDSSNYIEVVATTLDQKYSSQASIDVGTIQPKVLFYKNDIELGTMWENSLKNYHKINDKEIILAAPYFISPKDPRHPRLSWNWFINGTQVYNQSLQKNLMPLEVQEGISGTSQLRLEVENMDKIFQTAKKEINLEF